VTRLHVQNPPAELRPILNAMDSLFTRVGRAISIERRFTSVAAHEMKTPLAGLRAQAQIASNARSTHESREALQLLMHGVDRAAHMLDQLLDLARVEAISKDGDLPFKAVQLSDVFRDAMHDLEAKSHLKRISVAARFDVSELRGLAYGIHLIMRNLIANAILYCPEGSQVSIASVRTGNEIVLTVDDSGTGIAPQAREHAFERFNRLEQSGPDGVGLGLSIVLLVVELHEARIQLQDSPMGGLRVRLAFPQPESSVSPRPVLEEVFG
jgi:two-component system OmpR family sensor kinase/two-component system sensor histidine kinase QseC